jgi:chromosome segregation ATPase
MSTFNKDLTITTSVFLIICIIIVGTGTVYFHTSLSEQSNKQEFQATQLKALSQKIDSTEAALESKQEKKEVLNASIDTLNKHYTDTKNQAESLGTDKLFLENKISETTTKNNNLTLTIESTKEEVLDLKSKLKNLKKDEDKINDEVDALSEQLQG